ncbi:MAG: CRISPR-associated endoribonuclease Cas6 [Bacteroidetes bacterium]|nr:MAG: CRISPR-associated endoribonuclease Cas6 [Bacteroidota bacterium]
MRINISLESAKDEYKLPINYLYPLSAVVYKIFATGSESIAKWLHEKGFSDKSGRNLKLFNFSNLVFGKYQINPDFIRCMGSCSFIFSSPIETELIQTFINGIINLQSFQIGNKKYQSEFRISGIQLEKPPQFDDEQIFKTKSPISVSTIIEIKGEKKIYYYRPEDSGFTEAIQKNLIKKYEMIYQKTYNGTIEVSIPKGATPKSKLITIKEGSIEETKIKAFLTTISIKAEPDIMKTAYYCGLGERNSLGFGMLELFNLNKLEVKK